uniref:Uncharacterized protein n=1 Tax=Oryza meridionalis TaxID=40149 RepID=A0A0E0F3Q0_9ORYZ
MAAGHGEDGRETRDGCRSRANKLTGLAFSLFGRSRTIVTLPPPAKHACSCIAADDALLHNVVGRCRHRRVPPRARTAPLGLEPGAWQRGPSMDDDDGQDGDARLRWEERKEASPPHPRRPRRRSMRRTKRLESAFRLRCRPPATILGVAVLVSW